MRNLLIAHKGFCAILALQAAVFWAVVGTASPWTTAPMECAPGAMAEVLLGPSSWSVWDSFHGALAGMLLAALAGLPLFAAFGATGAVVKVVVWATVVALLSIVYLLVDRHESRPAALLATGGLAFCPPVLFHPATVLGNWHWTQLAFDYGLVLFALELARRPRGPVVWGLFGLASGLALFNCIASLPFVAVAWGLLALAAGGRHTARRFGAALAGGAVGVLPYLYKLLLHRPYGLPHVPADRTVGRLTRVEFQPERLLDLVYPELPWALHVHDVVSWLPDPATLRMELVWTGVTWIGLVAAAGLGIRRWRRGPPGERWLLPVALVPALFAALFALAYASLNTHLDMLPLRFTNVREPGHRILPPILAALVIGSGIGWARLAEALPRARPAMLALAILPLLVGLVSQVSMIQPGAPGDLAAYRGSCGDALGFNAAASFRGDAVAVQQACTGLGDAAMEEDCRVGAAWGVGFHGCRVGTLTVEQAPPGWDRSSLALVPEARVVCDALEPESRGQCLFGLGWFVGMLSWGQPTWPIDACDSLLAEADRTACWRGVGFPAGDHLHPSPWKVGAVLEAVPPSRWEEVAWGAGVAIGRTWSSREYGEWLCEETGMEEVEACKAGVVSRH